MSNVQYPMSNVQCPMSNVQCPNILNLDPVKLLAPRQYLLENALVSFVETPLGVVHGHPRPFL